MANRDNGDMMDEGIVTIPVGETADGFEEFAVLDAVGNEVSSALIRPGGAKPDGNRGHRTERDASTHGVPELLGRYPDIVDIIAPGIQLFFGGTGYLDAVALRAHLRWTFGDAAPLAERFNVMLAVDSSDTGAEFCGVRLQEHETLHVHADLDELLLDLDGREDHHVLDRVSREYLARIPDAEHEGSGSGRCRPRGMLEFTSRSDEFRELLDTQITELQNDIGILRTQLGDRLPWVWNRLWFDLHASSCGGAGSAFICSALPIIEEVCEDAGVNPVLRAHMTLPHTFVDREAREEGKALTYATLTELGVETEQKERG